MNRRHFLKGAAHTGISLTAGDALSDDPESAGAAAVTTNGAIHCASVMPLDGEWLLATDPQNAGRRQGWFNAPAPQAKRTKTPWIIQDDFPGYHGIAWYWREFTAPPNLHVHGRYLLRFWAVDYQADVWLNGELVGEHEGGETPFVLDVTEHIKPGLNNLAAVRVLNPTNDPIDGIVLNQTPHRNKVIPYTAGNSYDDGGIVDSVELRIAPEIYLQDMFVRPDSKTGILHIRMEVNNLARKRTQSHLEFTIAPAAGGETSGSLIVKKSLLPGKTIVEVDMAAANFRLWELDDPFLYRVTARVRAVASSSFDEQSLRCGFRDFRFEDGYFRLNGRRLFLKCSHTGNHFPVGLHYPYNPDWVRRDLFNVKAMGFNAIRFIAGVAERAQLDLCDEIGLLVYEENYASWLLADSPMMAQRFDQSLSGMILRDRSHPSVVMWGLLNETIDGPVFRHAVNSLPLVRSLDDSRMVMLSSGRFDRQLSIGSVSNPGSMVWETLLGREQADAAEAKPWSADEPGAYINGAGDIHAYPRIPHLPETIHFLRSVGEGGKHVFLSEYGIASGVDLLRLTRHYEQLNKESAEDAQFYRNLLNRFLTDWEQWRLADIFGRPEDFFTQSLNKNAGQRLLGLNAIRSNPNIAGYSLTGTVDQGMSGEGLFTTFREPKPGTSDALLDGLAPLRWCLFTEPVNIYRGAAIQLNAALANEDVLPPGEYPVRLQVFGPDNELIFARKLNVTIPKLSRSSEPPFSLTVYDETAVIDGPAGKYRFVAAFDSGAAAAGGETVFYVDDAARMPPVETEVTQWGEDPDLTKWLLNHNISARSFQHADQTAREVILVSASLPAGSAAESFKRLAEHISRGSTAIFLSPGVFAAGNNPVAWVPLAKKGSLHQMSNSCYHDDEWAKKHPIFDGLPTGMMDYTFYREIIPDRVWADQSPPTEAVSGGVYTALGYSSGLMTAVYRLGAGRFILNTLRIRRNLGANPAAERLLRNMLLFASSDLKQPLADTPLDFHAQLKSFGYSNVEG